MVDSTGHTEKMANLFDKLSDSYDEVGVEFFKPIAATLLRAMPPVEGEHWLDVGCGRGAGLRNVECEVDDAHSPTKIKGPFDTISSALVLFFLANSLEALRNWLPLLIPGGRLGLTTFGSVDPKWEYVDEVFAPHLSPEVKDARTSGKAGPFASDDGVQQMLAEAGFTNLRTQSSTINGRFADPQHWYDFTWSVGQRMMWLAIPEDLRADVRTEAESRLARFAKSDGSITFTQGIRNTLRNKPTS
jgi:SAM-dependent methyltransferase